MSSDNSAINEFIHNLYQFCQRKAHILLSGSIYDVVTKQALINLPNTLINDKSRYVCGLVVKTPLQYWYNAHST